MKPILVRVPQDEAAAVARIFDQHPGVTPQQIMRALLLTAPKIGITNAIAKHAAMKSKGFKP